MSEYIGEMVEVSADEKDWYERKLLAIVKDTGLKSRYVTRALNIMHDSIDKVSGWEYCRPIQEE